MPWTAPAIVRIDEPHDGDERSLLEQNLEYQRQTLLGKCAGLTADQLSLRSVSPSTMSLIGLLRHLTDVERTWFRIRFGGEDLVARYSVPANIDGEFDDAHIETAVADYESYQSEIALVTAAIRGRSLHDTFLDPHTRTRTTLRWLFLHMIAEYARHNGHADLLRERIDGVVGE